MSIGPISRSTRSTSAIDGGLVGDVELDAEAADLVADGRGGVAVAVGHDDGAGAAGHPAAGHGRADPAAAPGDDRHPVLDLHDVLLADGAEA